MTFCLGNKAKYGNEQHFISDNIFFPSLETFKYFFLVHFWEIYLS